jgi:hypothetical protein
MISQNLTRKYNLLNIGSLSDQTKFTHSVVLKVCDELDKAKDLHEYFKDKLIKHIK